MALKKLRGLEVLVLDQTYADDGEGACVFSIVRHALDV